MSKFIKLTPHVDYNCNQCLNGDINYPVNLIKGPESMFSYDDSKTVVCMVNSDKINRIYTGKVFAGFDNKTWCNQKSYENIEHAELRLQHTLIELESGYMFSVIEKPEYVSYLLAGRVPRNWPTNVARYWTLSRSEDDSAMVDEKMISEFRPISDLIRNGLE